MAKRSDDEVERGQPTGSTETDTKLVNLLALLLVQAKRQGEQISLLSRAGFRPVEIADLLGTTSNTVNVELSTQRRAKKAGRKK